MFQSTTLNPVEYALIVEYARLQKAKKPRLCSTIDKRPAEAALVLKLLRRGMLAQEIDAAKPTRSHIVVPATIMVSLKKQNLHPTFSEPQQYIFTVQFVRNGAIHVQDVPVMAKHLNDAYNLAADILHEPHASPLHWLDYRLIATKTPTLPLSLSIDAEDLAA